MLFCFNNGQYDEEKIYHDIQRFTHIDPFSNFFNGPLSTISRRVYGMYKCKMTNSKIEPQPPVCPTPLALIRLTPKIFWRDVPFLPAG